MIKTPKLRRGTLVRDEVKLAILSLAIDGKPHPKTHFTKELNKRKQYAINTVDKYLVELVDEACFDISQKDLTLQLSLNEKGRETYQRLRLKGEVAIRIDSMSYSDIQTYVALLEKGYEIKRYEAEYWRENLEKMLKEMPSRLTKITIETLSEKTPEIISQLLTLVQEFLQKRGHIEASETIGNLIKKN